jgi:hypothetical protein
MRIEIIILLKKIITVELTLSSGESVPVRGCMKTACEVFLLYWQR